MTYSASARIAFSARLKLALERAGYNPNSPTQLARLFATARPQAAVTVHAARKWLVGEAVPTRDKLDLLATLLDVKLEWLAWGTEKGPTGKARTADSAETLLLMRVRAYNPKQRAMLEDFFVMLERHRI